MFTGIIEHLGTIESLRVGPEGGRVTIHAPTLASKLVVSNSIAVNGCCLTIVSAGKDHFSADLSRETINKTSFGASAGELAEGAQVNLEQPLTAGKEFGGHFVLGHVDAAGSVIGLQRDGESWRYVVHLPENLALHLVSKGSITIDGISLTIAEHHIFARSSVQAVSVQVAVVPYTYEHTNIRHRKPGDAVNLEFDILGKYVQRYLNAQGAVASASRFNIPQLVEEGF
jgi:riboflavin synthase